VSVPPFVARRAMRRLSKPNTPSNDVHEIRRDVDKTLPASIFLIRLIATEIDSERFTHLSDSPGQNHGPPRNAGFNDL